MKVSFWLCFGVPRLQRVFRRSLLRQLRRTYHTRLGLLLSVSELAGTLLSCARHGPPAKQQRGDGITQIGVTNSSFSIFLLDVELQRAWLVWRAAPAV